MSKFKVTFYPENKSVEVTKDTSILSAAISAGIYINSSCGGDGVCGRCKVLIKKGRVLSQSTGLLSEEEKDSGLRLACLTKVQGDAEVEIPQESRIDLQTAGGGYAELNPQVEEIQIKAWAGEKDFAYLPLTRKIYLELSPPGLDDKLSDLERIYRHLKQREKTPVLRTGISNIRGLGELLRSSDWKVTVTLVKRSGSTEITMIEPGNTSKRNFGFCFDIGTTTISGQLVDLNTKKQLGTKAAYNKQATFGSDIISRIIYAGKPEGMEKLHWAVTTGINEIIHGLTDGEKVDLNEVTSIACAGNTTMMHLLLRIAPTYLRREPYVPTANFLPVSRAIEAGIKINPHGILACSPGVASYVGGDVTAGILSCGLDEKKKLSLLIDIGTNGEIVLGNREFMVACAASAGPAFEGSGVTSGMRASAGAIEEVSIQPDSFDVSYRTIRDAKPRGICGSGYIDLLAALLKAGILDKDGKIKALKHRRIRDGESGREFVIVFKDDSGWEADIVVNEADIDNLKRAKAAIYSGVSAMLRHMSLSLEDIEEIFIAGGFGTSLDIDSAVKIGLLPDLPKERFIFVGNSSLSGAQLMLLSDEAREKLVDIANKVTYFELSAEPAYMEEYMAALFFPHTDLSKFPSLKK